LMFDYLKKVTTKYKVQLFLLLSIPSCSACYFIGRCSSFVTNYGNLKLQFFKISFFLNRSSLTQFDKIHAFILNFPLL
jgi:hypothetical protein